MVTTEKKAKSSIDDVAGAFYRMQCGDTSAFDELYKMTVKYVQYTVMRAGVPSTDVEDVVQNTYIYIFNNYESCREPQAALSWIKKVAFSRSIDYLRKNSKEFLLSEEGGDYVFEESTLVAPIEMPEDVVENNETKRLVNEMLNKLPEKQLTIVRAFYFNDKKTREIAEEMGIPEGTVKASLARSRKTLEAELNSFAKKHGVKLVATAIVPVLSMLFTEEAKACAISTASMSSIYKAAVLGSRAKDIGVVPVINSVSSAGVSSASAASAGVNTVAASAVKTGAIAAAKAGGATFGKALATKIAVAVVSAAVIVTGSIVAVNTINKTAAEQQQVQSLEASVGAREIQYSNDISDEAKRLEHEMELQRLQEEVQSASVVPSQAVVAPTPSSIVEAVPSSEAPIEEPSEEEPEEEEPEEEETRENQPASVTPNRVAANTAIAGPTIEELAKDPKNYGTEVTAGGNKYFINDDGKYYNQNEYYITYGMPVSSTHENTIGVAYAHINASGDEIMLRIEPITGSVQRP